MDASVTEIWFRSALALDEITVKLGLADVAFGAENYWEWAIGMLSGKQLDITRPHTQPAEATDTRIFLLDNTRFTDELIVDVVSRLRSFVSGTIWCGRETELLTTNVPNLLCENR
jgi:hypothetical protein